MLKSKVTKTFYAITRKKNCKLKPFLNHVFNMLENTKIFCERDIFQLFIFIHISSTGTSSLGKFLAQNDSKYNSLFNDQQWRDTFDTSTKSDSSTLPTNSSHLQSNMDDLATRVGHYVAFADSLMQIPIAEAMLTYHKEHRVGVEEESSQVFVPFLNVSSVVGGIS